MNAVLAPLVTFIIGAVAGVIGWQQWKLARHKLQLDLFDRRYRVYDAARKFLSHILEDASFQDKHLWAFYSGISDAEFLFDSEVVEYLEKIKRRSIDMRTHQKAYEPLPVGDERSRLVETAHHQLVWLTDQITAMRAVFAPYLSFAKLT